MSLAALSVTPIKPPIPVDGPLLHVALFALSRMAVAVHIVALAGHRDRVEAQEESPERTFALLLADLQIALFTERFDTLIDDEISQQHREYAQPGAPLHQ